MDNMNIIATSRAVALERYMDVIANNVANMNTTGFKSAVPLFTEFMEKPKEGASYSMVETKGILRNLSAGPISSTGNPLDIAIEGDGYLQVDTLGGTRYTRAGNLTINDQRELTTAAGLPVLDDTGNRISLPANIRELSIGPTGQISGVDAANPGVSITIGKIGVVRFEREQLMTTLGGGIYTTDEKPIPAESSFVRQGFLEGSNVQSVLEMTNMIQVNREYQSIQKLLSNQHDLLRNAYAKITKLS